VIAFPSNDDKVLLPARLGAAQEKGQKFESLLDCESVQIRLNAAV
jgi:hypothetical protein